MTSPKLQASRWSRRLAPMLWVGLVLGTLPRPAEAQTLWELTPYRIQVVLCLGRAPEFTPAFRTDLARDLVARVDALIGAAWDVRVSHAPRALRYAMIRDVETVTLELLEEQLSEKGHSRRRSADLAETVRGPENGAAPERPSEKDALPENRASPQEEPFDFDALDKVILLVVLPSSSTYRVVARELDVRTRQWNTPVSVPVWLAAKLCDAALDAVRKAFAPLARVADVPEKNVVILRLRAAGFPARDQSIVMVRPGEVFRPIIRHNDRYGKLKGINPIPWTFLTVEEVTEAGLTCKLHTGLRTPLSARRRGRFEQLALAVVPPHTPTRLVLRSRIDPQQVLPGYDVYSHPPNSKKTELVGRTDRQGSVIIPPDEHLLRVLLVKNGREFLARLPLVPGREAELSAAIANDDQRLEAEGFVTGMQEELIDLVTRRQILVVKTQIRIKERKYDEAKKLLHQLRGLESRDDFALYLTQEQKKIFSPDKLIQAKIDQMFSKTREAVNEYLDPDVIDQLERQLRKAEASERSPAL